MRASRAWTWRPTRGARRRHSRARDDPSRIRESRKRARTFSVDGERDEEGGEEDVGARGRRGKGNRSRWLIDSFD